MVNLCIHDHELRDAIIANYELTMAGVEPVGVYHLVSGDGRWYRSKLPALKGASEYRSALCRSTIAIVETLYPDLCLGVDSNEASDALGDPGIGGEIASTVAYDEVLQF